ncbi:MAG: flagellar basal-body rod protein FlgG [bacterium]
MIRSLFSGGTGMRAQQFNVDIVSNNLSNVNTNGYKRTRADFEDLFYEHLKVAGSPSADAAEHPTGISVGMGVRTGATSKVYSQGNARKTENSLDVMIKGDGFFQIMQPDGTTAYSRDGAFKMDGDGNLVTSSGLYVQGGDISIPENATGITIRADGTVSAQIQGQEEPENVGQLELAKFVNPSGLKTIGSNLLKETTASGSPQVVTPGTEGAGELQQGFIESSNVDVIEALTDLIAMQRAYEFNHRTIRTSDKMLARATTLLQ